MNATKSKQSWTDAPELGGDSLFALLLRHKKKLVLLPLASIGLGVLVIFFFPRSYASEAKLFLQVGRESVGLDPTATTGQMISFLQNGREDEVKSAIELLTSRGVITRVVDRLTPEVVLGEAGSGKPAEPNVVVAAVKRTIGSAIGWIKGIDPISRAEEAAIEIERHFEPTVERGSSIIVCRYESSTPELAQQILDALLDEYQLEHARIHRNQQSLEFFVQQRDELKAQLDEKERALRDKRNELGLGSIAGRRDSLEQQRHGIELAKSSTQQDLSTAEAHVQELRRELRDEPERTLSQRTLAPNTGADLMREQLYALKLKEKEYSARYNDDHPMLVAIMKQVAEAQAVADEEEVQREATTDDVNMIHQQLSLELRQELARIAGLKSRLTEIGAQREAVLAELRQLNVDEVAIAELEREQSVIRGNWMQYAENLEQARIDQQREASRVSNISIAQATTLSRKPVTPSKVLVGLASLVLATAGTTFAVIGSERVHARRRQRRVVIESPRAAAEDVPNGSALGRAPVPR